MTYACSKCHTEGVRLWRPYMKFHALVCQACADPTLIREIPTNTPLQTGDLVPALVIPSVDAYLSLNSEGQNSHLQEGLEIWEKLPLRVPKLWVRALLNPDI